MVIGVYLFCGSEIQDGRHHWKLVDSGNIKERFLVLSPTVHEPDV